MNQDAMSRRFYVRRRGRITGPFEAPSVMKMVESGKLSRFDEISLDQQMWMSAGDSEWLFPPPSIEPAEVESTAEPAQPVAGEEALGAGGEAASSDGWSTVGGGTVSFECVCGRAIESRVEDAGRRAHCPSCQREVTLPRNPIAADNLATIPLAGEEGAPEERPLAPPTETAALVLTPTPPRPAPVLPRSALPVDPDSQRAAVAPQMPDRFSIGWVLSRGWRCMTANYWAFLGAALFLGFIMLAMYPGFILAGFVESGFIRAGGGLAKLALPLTIIGGLAGLVLSPPLNAGYLFVGVIGMRSGRAGAGDLFCGFQFWGRLLGIVYLKAALFLLVYIVVTVPLLILGLVIGYAFLEETGMRALGLLLGIVGGVAILVLNLGIGIRLFLSELICIDKGFGVIDSLKTSWAVSRPIAGRLLAIGLLYGGAVILTGLMFSLPAILFAGVASSSGSPVSAAFACSLALWALLQFFLGNPYFLGLIGATYELAISTHETRTGAGVR